MSFPPKITDDEMQYFQFKAKQLFISRKEDHDWNEFCKRNACTCCSCQSIPQNKAANEIGVQTSKTVPPRSHLALNSSRSALPRKNLPEALNEIKTKLERIDLALSDWKAPTTSKDILNELVPEVKLQSCSGSVISLNPINEKRIELIQNSLKASLQRLQSSARFKANALPTASKKSNIGYFLPHELQKQRQKARNAYLASLSKTKNNTVRVVEKASINNRRGNRLQDRKVVSYSRSGKKLETEKTPTLVHQENVTDKQDENIETAIDGILEDLMGETVLVVNKITQAKKRKSQSFNKAENEEGQDNLEIINANFEKNQNQHVPKFDVADTKPYSTLNHQSDFQSTNCKDTGSSIQQETFDSPKRNDAESEEKSHDKRSSQNLNSRNGHKLFIEPSIVKEIGHHRNEYMKYLKQMSRTKKGNFDPCTLAKMVAESLLDDCIEEVSLEIQDLPASLIADLYDKEFLQTL